MNWRHLKISLEVLEGKGREGGREKEGRVGNNEKSSLCGWGSHKKGEAEKLQRITLYTFFSKRKEGAKKK